jgi:hypothetical protein
MVAVRYVALAALVLWLALMLDVLWGDVLRQTRMLAAACGGLVLVSLFVMKFVGPPPRGFVPRAAIVGAMLLLLTASAFHHLAATTALTIDAALGFVLLWWYVRE